MAIVDRYTLDQLVDQVRLLIGQKIAAQSRSPDTTAANDWGLYSDVNAYVENFPMRCAELVRPGAVLLFPCWYEEEQTVTTSSGSSDAYLPNNCFWPVKIWDNTNDREVEIVRHAGFLVAKLRKLEPGPPRYAIVHGMATSTTWRYKLRLRPDTVSGVTPSLVVDQYRIPAKMDETDAANAVPDIDPHYQQAVIAGLAAKWTVNKPNHGLFLQREREAMSAVFPDAEIARIAA